MLKSRFNLVFDDDEEQPSEEELPEDEPQPRRKQKGGRSPGELDAEPSIPELPERQLNKSEVSVRLSLLGKTAEGDGYTYLKCKITGLKLTHLDVIKSFTHIMFLDVSNNLLDLNALQIVTKLPNLILIQADKNRLESAALKRIKYLQVIIFNENNITSVYDVHQENLSTLELGNNKISEVKFQIPMPTLKVLDFRNNVITGITDFDFPNLDSLYLAGNKITSLVGIERCVNLRILHVRANPIKLLNGFDEALTKLSYLNLRNCKVGTLIQVKKLRVLKGIETLIMKGCPFMGGTGREDGEPGPEEDDPQTRIEMLAALPRLKRINKDVVTPEERQEAKDVMTQWLEEGDNDVEEEVAEEEVVVEGEQHEDLSNTED